MRAVVAVLTVLIVVCCAVVAVSVRNWVMRHPLGELPHSAHVLEHELRRHGVDTVHLYAVSIKDDELLDALVARWYLKELLQDEESPMSFVEGDRPGWWPGDSTAMRRRFGTTDWGREQYWSIWERKDGRMLYIEIGSW